MEDKIGSGNGFVPSGDEPQWIGYWGLNKMVANLHVALSGKMFRIQIP